MSLFPAYCGTKPTNNQDTQSTPGPSWLSNSTFAAPFEQISSLIEEKSSTSTEDSCSKREEINLRKRKKSRKREKLKKNVTFNEGLYYEDSTPLIVTESIPLPQIQLTKPSTTVFLSNKKKIKKKKKNSQDKTRYFNGNIEDQRTKYLEMKNPESMEIEEFLSQTEKFNIALRDDPHDINVWVDYVKLQDSGAGSFQGCGEKKLSIIDRALKENPESEQLLDLKMCITESLFPMDKVEQEAKAIVTKFPKNLVGWHWVLNSSQHNLSKMTAPGVLLIYGKVFEGISKAHIGSYQLLDFLLKCGLFLRQCGLWEQLWALLELYLELNLTTAGSGLFKVDVKVPEKEIQEREDSILSSGLPLGALWLRVERLREGIYFAGVLEGSTDPQRVVLPEDMTPLLFPVVKEASSRLILYAILLLKVPPLPLNQAFVTFSRLDTISTSLDSVELLLAAKFSKGETSYLGILPELLLGPQYIANDLGRNEYFHFVNDIFNKCTEHCDSYKVYFKIWQMRWWRWLYRLRKSLNFDDPIKTYLSLAKKILKENRDAISLYAEYALLENEGGDFEAALKVLETTINLRDPPLLAGIIYKNDLCNLYKIYIGLLIERDLEIYKVKIMAVLIALAFGEPVKNITPRDELIKKCRERFRHISTEVLRDIKDRSIELSDVIIQNFSVSWLICHAWFLYITDGIWGSVTLLGNAIKELNASESITEGNLFDTIIEGLYEGLLEIFSYYCQRSPGNNIKLFEMAEKALKCYPKNSFFLNTLYSCELTNLKWSKLFNDIISTESPISSALVYFMIHVHYTRDVTQKASAGNRLYSLLEKLKNRHERCPLFWRLLLQASSLKDSEVIKRTFYQSLDKCPWVKILYYEAAKLLPGDLPEIQDLIVEKELRLHITPEELEILREGA